MEAFFIFAFGAAWSAAIVWLAMLDDEDMP